MFCVSVGSVARDFLCMVSALCVTSEIFRFVACTGGGGLASSSESRVKSMTAETAASEDPSEEEVPFLTVFSGRGIGIEGESSRFTRVSSSYSESESRTTTSSNLRKDADC